MLVRAVQMGYYKHKRRRPGTKTAIFDYEPKKFDKEGKPLLPSWLEEYKGKLKSTSSAEENKKKKSAKLARVAPAPAPEPEEVDSDEVVAEEAEETFEEADSDDQSSSGDEEVI